MELLKLISWKDPQKDLAPTPGHDLLVFGPEGFDHTLDYIFTQHQEYKGKPMGNMIVEVSSRHTTMVVVFLEKRHRVTIHPSIDTTAHHKKQTKKTKKKRGKKVAA